MIGTLAVKHGRVQSEVIYTSTSNKYTFVCSEKIVKMMSY